MDSFDRRAHFDRSDELAPLPPPRQTPVFGRSALAVAVLAAVIYLLTVPQGLPGPGPTLAVRQVLLAVGPVAGIALAVISLVRKERKGPAVAALCIVVVAPLLFALIVTLAWWGYGQGLGVLTSTVVDSVDGSLTVDAEVSSV